MHREHHRWESPSLGRPMDLLWYGHWGRPVLAFPTSLGSCSQNEDCGLFRELQGKIDGGEIQVVCVDALDADIWYDRSAHPWVKLHRYGLWERYLLEEVLPLIHGKAQRTDLVVYGASWGGFHAMNFGLRHPESVSRIVSLSGMYDLHRMLDGWWSDDCYFQCPTAYAPNFPPEIVERVRETGIVIATGEHDHLVDANREFAGVLTAKGIPVHVEIWPGVFGHDWDYWAHHLPRFL